MGAGAHDPTLPTERVAYPNHPVAKPLPGYLQFLGDPEEADVMTGELASILEWRSKFLEPQADRRPDLSREQSATVGVLCASFALIEQYATEGLSAKFIRIAEEYLRPPKNLPVIRETGT